VRETIIKCDLCLKDITHEGDIIPRIKVKAKPKGGWRMDTQSYSWNSMELCSDCEQVIFDAMMTRRVTGANFRLYKEKEKVDE